MNSGAATAPVMSRRRSSARVVWVIGTPPAQWGAGCRLLLMLRTGPPPIDRVGELFRGGTVRFLMTMNGGGRPPDQELFAEMGRFVEELSKAGVLLATGGLDPAGTHVTAVDGKITMTDGPYTETKETIVSFALIDVRSKEEAIELSRRFWAIVRDGEGDMRQVFGPEQ